MLQTILSFRKAVYNRLLPFVLLLALSSNSAFASIVNPETQTQSAQPSQTPKTIAETQELLDRASHIAFEGAAAVQKLQTQSVDKSTAEMLKNYMADIVYVPKAILPSDAEVLDEPWLSSTAGTTTGPAAGEFDGSEFDGMVVPNLDDDEPSSAKLKNSPTTYSVRSFLQLLQPIQNALITSPFGFRWGRPHQGIDLAAPVGTPIRSAEGGRIVYSGWKAGYGNFVAVDHGHGYQTHYAHCSKILVHTGQTVNKGQLIARVGNTGNSTGPHLHFEVVAHGIHRNPIKFINHIQTLVHAP